MQPLVNHLSQLESADLIRLAQTRPEVAYLFRHTLVQEAVYGRLLRQDREALHRSVAASLQRLYEGQPVSREMATLLGRHFYEAGDDEEAEGYYCLAADLAMKQYANGEAIMHYSRALEAAGRRGNGAALFHYYQKRGLAYEIVGEFERARADQERALQVARGADDRTAEWEALLALGKLWAARDYRQTGRYFQQALALARQFADPCRLGRSLNRVGNWYVNVEEPQRGLAYHQEALAIFRMEEDRPGIAATLDLMGLAAFESGYFAQGMGHYNEAIELFRELDDRPGLSSSLAMRSSASSAHFLMLAGNPGKADPLVDAMMALQVAQEIGWRAGEAFALIQLAFSLSGQGEFGRALEVGQRALAIAEEIGHHQWQTAAHYILGRLYQDMLNLPAAEQHVERALALAREVASLLWINLASGEQATIWITQGKLAEAEGLLRPLVEPGSGSAAKLVTVAQRSVWTVVLALALAHQKWEQALAIADRLIVAGPTEGGEPVGYLWYLRGRALAGLGRLAEAERVLREGAAAAEAYMGRVLLWRVRLALARIQRAQGKLVEAEETLAATYRLMEQLAASIPDERLRMKFRQEAAVLMKGKGDGE